MNPLLSKYETEINYLLHRLSPAERERFGQRVVEDAESFDRVREAEIELYDAHARGEMPPELRDDFVFHLLNTPAQIERLRVAEALLRKKRPVRIPVFAYWALAAGVLLGLSFVPRFLRNSSGKSAENQAVVLRLSLQQTRSAAAAIPEFAVSGSAGPVEIRIAWDPAEPGSAFRADIKRASEIVWKSVEPLRPQGIPPELMLRIGPDVLRPGLHEIAVRSASGDPVGFAEFRTQ